MQIAGAAEDTNEGMGPSARRVRGPQHDKGIDPKLGGDSGNYLCLSDFLEELSLEELSFDDPSLDEVSFVELSFEELSDLDFSSFLDSLLPPSDAGACDFLA